MMWAPKHCKVSHICKKYKTAEKGAFFLSAANLTFLNGFISRQNKLLTWNQPHMDTNILNFNNKERAFRYLQPFQICFKLKHWTWHCQNFLHFFICILVQAVRPCVILVSHFGFEVEGKTSLPWVPESCWEAGRVWILRGQPRTQRLRERFSSFPPRPSSSRL